MAKNLLNTNTVNFQDMMGNGRSYQVPTYQRDYSWTEEQWEDLWLDVNELRPNAERRHYMGAVVVKSESDRRFVIIDGQQRIATLTIFGLAVISRLNRMNDEDGKNPERASALRSRYIGEKDPASLTEVSKLTLNKHDDGFFQDYLVQLREPINPRSLPRSNRLLWDCFVFYKKKIEEDTSLNENGLKVAELLSEVIARRLMFILITVDDEISAYTVFETLNARGLELTTTDLLKNYLFSKLHSTADLESLQRRWERLVVTVRQERFGEFLRYHYLTIQKQIRTGRLFKIVRDRVKTPEEVLDLVSVLEKRAELYDALSDSNHSLWAEIPTTKLYIRELNLFRVRQMTPLLFAAFEKLDKTEFERVLKMVAVISFRYTIISGLNTNELEPVYHEAAKAVLNGFATRAAEVFETLRPIYVSDEKFKSDFGQKTIATSGQRRKVAKYILCKLESDMSERDCNFETDPSSIEHILPENPIDEWENSIPRTAWDATTYRLGNLTLLKASTNRDIGNSLYCEKIEAYQTSEYSISKKIPEIAPEDWTLELVDERQTQMAARSAHIWRVNF